MIVLKLYDFIFSAKHRRILAQLVWSFLFVWSIADRESFQEIVQLVMHPIALNFICPKRCATFSRTGLLSLSCCQTFINLCALILTHPWHVHCYDKHYSVWLCLSSLSVLWSLVASLFKVCSVTLPRFLWKEDSVTKTRKEVLLKWQLAAIQRPFLL